MSQSAELRWRYRLVRRVDTGIIIAMSSVSKSYLRWVSRVLGTLVLCFKSELMGFALGMIGTALACRQGDHDLTGLAIEWLGDFWGLGFLGAHRLASRASLCFLLLA